MIEKIKSEGKKTSTCRVQIKMDSPQEKLGHFNFFFLFPCVVITHLLLIAGPMSQRKAILCVDLLFLYHLSSFFFLPKCVYICANTHWALTNARQN